MKNKTSQPPIPDVDIIDLEAEEKTPDEIQEDFQEETEYEEIDSPSADDDAGPVPDRLRRK